MPDPLKLSYFFVCASFLLTGLAHDTGAQARTPAEIEIRRSAMAERLAVLAEEQTALEAQLRGLENDRRTGEDPASGDGLDPKQARIANRLDAVVTESASLNAEAGVLGAIVTRTPTGPVTRADPPGLAPLQIGAGQVTAGNAFNPAITVIADGLYYADHVGADRSVVFAPGGFGNLGAQTEIENPTRGFSLREAELTLSGAVDPYFDVWATFGIADGEIETEEVYLQTRQLLPGVQVRFGQFFSGIGYINRQHRHQWDFVDQTLPYEALFGSNLKDVGVQVTWLPSLPIYTQFGFEALQGDNAGIANPLFGEFPTILEERPGPRLFNGFFKVSPDLGFSNTLQAGASFGWSRAHQEIDIPGGVLPPEGYEGAVWFLVTDLIWRYDSNRQYGQGDLTVQGEYIYRSKDLDPLGPSGLSQRSAQDGLYAQMVYGVAPRWTIGGRVEALGLKNRMETPGLTTDLPGSERYSANLTFNPTEYSRLRFQYNHGSFWNSGTSDFDQVLVQFQMSLGVHGAHVF